MMEGQELKQKSKSTQTPSYLSLDIYRYCKKKYIGSTFVLYLKKKNERKRVAKSY